MELRTRNNLIMMVSIVLIFILLILSTLERERKKARSLTDHESSRPARVSVLSLAIESILTEEGMVDSLVSGTIDRDPTALSPAESLLIVNLSGVQEISIDSVRREYLKVRARLLNRGP